MMKQKMARWFVGILAALMLVQGAAVPVLAGPVEGNTVAVMTSSSKKTTPGKWVKKGKNLYRYDASNRIIKGAYFTVDGKKYYARLNGCVIQKKGWFRRADGEYAFALDGGVIKPGVVQNNKSTYYVNNNGLKRNGHFKGAGGKYYYTVKGRIRFGWNNKGNRSYYVGPQGWLLTGTQKIGGTTYNFDNTGVLVGGRLTVTMNGVRVTDSVDNILSKIVMAEVGGFNNREVYKAQAIAAYSYILYEQAHGNSAPSVVGRNPTALVTQSVAQVSGYKLTYNNSAAFTPYYSFSNGKTNNSKDFWGSSFPYLKTRASKYDNLAPNFEKKYFMTRTKFIQMLNRIYGKGNYTLPSDRNKWIVMNTNAQGYVTGRLQVCGRQPTVEYFYQTMIGLRSPSFTVKYVPSRDGFQFVTRGWGHGVGMSQYGAYYYVTKQNWNYQRVLSHYFPGTTLMAG